MDYVMFHFGAEFVPPRKSGPACRALPGRLRVKVPAGLLKPEGCSNCIFQCRAIIGIRDDRNVNVFEYCHFILSASAQWATRHKQACARTIYRSNAHK